MCLGVPACVVSIDDAHMATVDVEGVRRQVNVLLVLDDGLEVGDWVLVHVGFAMSKIDAAEAAKTLAFMRELGSVYDDEVDALRGDP